MKKQLALIITLTTAIGANAFGQGYVIFLTAKNNAYDEFTTPGSGVVAPGNVTATFLWALVGTPDPLGAGVATTGVNYTADNWSTISSMISSGWNIAENAGNGNAEADVTATSTGVFRGELAYNGGNAFPLANTTGGDTYELVVIGWDNLTGATTLGQAMTNGVALGWSNSFNYTTGATVTATVEEFNQSGMNPFGVALIPEPATLALAGLGGLSLFFLRRKIGVVTNTRAVWETARGICSAPSEHRPSGRASGGERINIHCALK